MTEWKTLAELAKAGDRASTTTGRAVKTVRRFEKGDKVLGPWISRPLPLAEVLEVFESARDEQVLLIAYYGFGGAPAPTAGLQSLVSAAELTYLGDRKFFAAGETIYRLSNGEVVAQSKNWASIIADFLETFKPPFPGESADSPAAHEDWRELNE